MSAPPWCSAARLRPLLAPAVAFAAGIGPWLLINAVFVQLASFVRLSGPSISAVLAVFVQVGTLAALLYTVWPPRRAPEWLSISLTAALNVGGGVALTLAWHHEVLILGHARPVVAIIATAAAGCSGAISVVQLYPLTARGSHATTAALSAGMGSNGIVASLLGLAVAAPSHYFAAVTGVVIVAAVASVALAALLPPPQSAHDTHAHTHADASAVPLINETAPEPADSSCSLFDLIGRPGWSEASLQLSIACLNYSLISLTPYALPTLLRAASIAAPAVGSLSRFVVALLPLPPRRLLLLPSASLCALWLALFFAAIYPPASHLWRALTLACLLAFNVVYALTDTLLFLLAGQSPSQLREACVRLVGAGQQTGAGIGSLLGLLFVTVWP